MMDAGILAGLTLFTNFLCMAVSLWFAVYLLARSPANPLSFRAVMALLALAFYFYIVFREMIDPAQRTDSLSSLGILLALVAAHDLTHYLLPEKKRREWYWLARGVVLIGVVGIALLFTAPATPDCLPASICPGQLSYPWVVIDLIKLLAYLAILFNLWQIRTGENRIYNLTFYGAVLLGASSLVYGFISTALDVRLPRIFSNLIILSALGLLLYSVARNRTLVAGRTLPFELPVTLVTISAIVAIYYGWARELNIPREAILLLLVLAIFTHSAYDFVRELLARTLQKQELTMRRELRLIAGDTPSEPELHRFFQRGLAILCHNLRAPTGFIAVRQADHYEVVATRHSLPVGTRLPEGSIPSESGLQNTGVYARQPMWITPASLGEEYLAVIGVGRRLDKTTYGVEDIFWLEDIADEVARMVSSHLQADRQAERSQAVAAAVPAGGAAGPAELVPAVEAAGDTAKLDGSELLSRLAYTPQPDLVRWVEECLRNLNDYASLGNSPLAGMLGIEAGDHLETGKRLQARLIGVIEKLRPPGARPPEPLPRGWYAYTILYDAYVEERLARDIMSKLYISEGTYFRLRRQVLRSVARALVETGVDTKNNSF